ncbi:MAG: 2-C-methyl-D-erythritol 4-phosphate cytidylyltransferase [Thermoleophilia bacterium]|nr:2-C-methyl-D-erythritol 4-phosphate cytidylyltransferase [Thermoleophilia bacterium]
MWAVIAAAGRGERLAAPYPKAFAKLADRPLLAESVERLDASEWIEGIVVVAPPEWEEPAILLAEELGAAKVAAVVTGGETRTQSVRAGVAEVPPQAAVVLVHDSARPVLPGDVVERLVTALAEEWDGAVPAVPVRDTLKRADGEAVGETVDRSGLWAAQTPQAFVADALRRALDRGVEASDCAGLVQSAGGRVRLVPGDARLLKVTDGTDLALVDALVAAEKRR